MSAAEDERAYREEFRRYLAQEQRYRESLPVLNRAWRRLLALLVLVLAIIVWRAI